MKELIIFGEASQKIVKTFKIAPSDLNKTLMNFLLQNGIPIASSCSGEGRCQKCTGKLGAEIILTCQKSLAEIFIKSDQETLRFSYL
jgi:ferredoxin